MNDQTLAILILTVFGSLYFLFTVWVLVTPFFPALASLFPPVRYVLLSCGTVGLIFIGSLSFLTVYSLYAG